MKTKERQDCRIRSAGAVTEAITGQIDRSPAKP